MVRQYYLGLDPGVQTTGWGVVDDRGRWVNHGIILTEARDGLPTRLQIISTQTKALLEKYKPQAIGIEKVFFKNADIVDVVQARGVLLHTAFGSCSRIVEAPAYTVKRFITGYAKASKREMQIAIRDRLRLARIPQPDDSADGLGMALYTLSILGPQAYGS